MNEVGEVVPAREGLRLCLQLLLMQLPKVGEVVPAREGLRLFCISGNVISFVSERLFQQEKD